MSSLNLRNINTAEDIMLVGTVKWFSDIKGYGFIASPGVDGDVFVHFSAIEMDGYRSIKPNTPVEFALERTERGYLAQSVRPVADLVGQAFMPILHQPSSPE